MNLNQLRNLSIDWNLDGAERPNDNSINKASKIIDAINRKTNSLLPSVEGGVLIHYENNNFGVYIECYNDGEIGYTLTNNRQVISSKDSNDKDFDMLTAIAEIQQHLN